MRMLEGNVALVAGATRGAGGRIAVELARLEPRCTALVAPRVRNVLD